MEFKKPIALKRHSDGFNSPDNRKKTRTLSTTIATPKQCRNSDLFDDNFSQFFNTQFVKQISGLEPSSTENSKTEKKVEINEYEYTQCDGLSQFLYDDQLDDSIPPGQQNRTEQHETEHRQTNDVEQKIIENESLEFSVLEDVINESESKRSEPDANENDNIEGENGVVKEAELTIQNSQLFLKELTTLQMNISSIVDETINASKFGTQDFLDPSNDQFEVFKSSVTNSQYLHRKRPNASSTPNTEVFATPATAAAKHTQKSASISSAQTNLNTETMDDQLLAAMVMTTQTLANNTEQLEDELLAAYTEDNEADESEQLNECIDPDSSALAFLSDDEDKENIQTASKATTNQRTPLNPRHSLVRTVQQTETAHHSPVTASNYLSMGPFFGLPMQVKKLIKTFKNIDDLYGKSMNSPIFSNRFTSDFIFRMAKGVSAIAGH